VEDVGYMHWGKIVEDRENKRKELEPANKLTVLSTSNEYNNRNLLMEGRAERGYGWSCRRWCLERGKFTEIFRENGSNPGDAQ